ncbi:MAG: ABC transporter ATP-binding protein, partial [Pikeienuella sp.]
QIERVVAAAQEKRVAAMFSLMHLQPDYRRRFPAQMSGGEQQRVALARALVSNPELLLLDEPMSALDAKLKKSLQSELKRLHREIGATFVLVTHDLEEAMMLADRICVMVAGRIEQVGPPEAIYRSPASHFVAGFIGDTNFLPVSVSRDGAEAVIAPLAGDGAPVRLSADRLAPRVTEGEAELLIRPEDGIISIERPAPGDWHVEGVVAEKFTKGSSTQYRLDVAEMAQQFALECSGFDTGHLALGAHVFIRFDPAHFYVVEPAR